MAALRSPAYEMLGSGLRGATVARFADAFRRQGRFTIQDRACPGGGLGGDAMPATSRRCVQAAEVSDSAPLV